MNKTAFGVPVRTRLPLKAWAVAVIVALLSLVTSTLHVDTAPDHSLLASITVQSAFE
jgi:hypothetical protein